MKRSQISDTVASIQDEQKQILYNEIRDVQIELKKYCSQKNFELFLISKVSRINDKEIKRFKIELKNFFIQQFFIQISIQKIQPRFHYNIDAKIVNNKEKNIKFSDIITNSICFKDFILLSTKIHTNDLFQIYLWTFSIIPSYFNFFLSEDDESYFLFFLEKLRNDHYKYFKIYSSIIYYHPLFLCFCQTVFNPVFESVLHDDESKSDPPSKLLQNLAKTIHLCPSIVKKVLQMIPESDRMKHVNEYFYEQLVLFPHRFFVLPEYYVLPHRTIQVLNLAFDNFIEELISYQNPLKLHFQDRTCLIFASYDLEFINYKMLQSKRKISNGPSQLSKQNQNEPNKMSMNHLQNQNLNIPRIPRTSSNQTKPSNQNENLNSGKEQNQKQQLNQNPKTIRNQNEESISSSNQNQQSSQKQQINESKLTQKQRNDDISIKNKEPIQTFKQIQDLNSTSNQKSLPIPNQNPELNAKNSRRMSLKTSKSQNPNANLNSIPKATRRLSLTPNPNQDQKHNPNPNTNPNTNANSNASNSSNNNPQSKFSSSPNLPSNRKRSLNAIPDSRDETKATMSPSQTARIYKYTFIEVSKGKERRGASEVLDFEKFISSSFLAPSEDASQLSLQRSSSSTIASSDLPAFQTSSTLVREEISSFFHNFRKLLQNSDTLPILDFKSSNNNNGCDCFDIVAILREFLVSKGGSFSTLIARAACFESISQYLNRISGSELYRMIKTYKKMALSMKALDDEKLAFNSYKKKTKTVFEKTFIFYKLIFILGDTFLYDESRRKTSKEIVDDSFLFYNLYKRSKSIDPVIAQIQYHSFIHNLRFNDFCEAHSELKKYDDLMFSYMQLNQENIIRSQPKSAKLFDKLNLIKDRFMFEPIVKNIQHAFEINAVPYEKFDIIRKSFENVEGWLRSIMEYGADDMLPFSIFIFALANPKKFVSNSVYMYLFLLSSIWKIEQNETPVVLTRLKCFISLVFNSFRELSSFLALKTFTVEILYILDYSKLQNNDNEGENENDDNNNFKKKKFISLIDFIDEGKNREPGKPFRVIYQDELPIIGELIFHDCSQNFSLNANININQNLNSNQNANESENVGVISNLISNVIGQKKNQYDVLVIESDRLDFVKKAVSKNKNIQKKIIFCDRSVVDEMKQTDIQCFKIMPRFSLFRALNEIFNLVVNIE